MKKKTVYQLAKSINNKLLTGRGRPAEGKGKRKRKRKR
jgi:hypothetical protein